MRTLQPMRWPTFRTCRLVDKPKGRFSSSATRCASLTGSSWCRNCADSISCFSIGFPPNSSMYFMLTPCCRFSERPKMSSTTSLGRASANFCAVGMSDRARALPTLAGAAAIAQPISPQAATDRRSAGSQSSVCAGIACSANINTQPWKLYHSCGKKLSLACQHCQVSRLKR